MIELKNISKSFGRTHALRSVSLGFPDGRTSVLIGPSGCGKSTVLRLIIGLTAPDQGTIMFSSQELTRLTVASVRIKMGYVIQEGGLFPHLSAGDNITIMARHLKWPVSSIEKRVDELLELTQFPREGLERFPRQLSGGQQQRVSLMRALMLDPAVLLLDEPLGALDPMIRSGLQKDLNAIFNALHKTVILVTHDMGEAGYFGGEIALFRDGQVVQKGSLHDLVHAPADPFVTRFINAQRSPLDALGPNSS